MNQKMDISVCISDTAGDTINVPVDINIWNAVASYPSGNVFSVEVLDPKNLWSDKSWRSWGLRHQQHQLHSI